MTRMGRTAPETRQDICRAEFLVASAQGLTRDEGSHALKLRAAIEGRSVHAEALAVLAAEPTDELLIAHSSQQTPSPHRRHLYALKSLASDEPMITTDHTAPTVQGGRHRRR